ILEHKKLIDHLAGKPFALIGINCDRELSVARSLVEKYEIAWPTIWDGEAGPISKAWNINSWTSVIVLDRKGIIRFRDARDTDLVKAVDGLLSD
ncbi:MAG: resA 8, partial [Verrucomicrobiales bacterium]|nr:resA 8 [Verrucomicrobiales bacterium]